MSKLLDLLIPYVQISKAILVEKDSHNDDAKDRIANLERKFQDDADDLVYELLKHVDTSDANTDLAEVFRSALVGVRDAMQGGDADEFETNLNIRAIDRTAEKLADIAAKQQLKGSFRRKVEHYWWAIVIVSIAAVYFGLRLYSAVPTYDQIETRDELIAGYTALQKVDRYDDWAGTRARKGGWLKGIILWPIEPTEDEIEFAGDMLWLSIGVHDYLLEEGLICNNTLSGPLENEDIDTKLENARLIGDFANTSAQQGNAIELTAAALDQNYSCE